MQIEYVPLASVPTAATVGESDKVLIESGGEIKKTAVSNIGGDELPEITGSDDGKVLTVDDGSAVWATPATPASPVVVLGLDESTGAFDKTWGEILAYVTAGTLVCNITSEENISATLMIVGDVATYDDGGTNKWRISFFDLANPETIVNAYADSASGYPVLDD